MIISASRRTDLPAFYAEWFMNRIRAGSCTVPNPFNPHQISRVSLKPDDVTAIVFWTRNPKPLMDFLPELDSRGYKYYFLYTITGYPRVMESAPERHIAVGTFQELSRRLGREKVIWRYDPLILSNLTPLTWHQDNFLTMAQQLAGYTERVMVSVVEEYRKTVSRLEKETGAGFQLLPGAFDEETYVPLFQYIGKTAPQYGITPYSCAEDIDLSSCGIVHGSCVDADLVYRITGKDIVYRKDPSQRKFCQCTVSKDIGVNSTCLFNCRYCYATTSAHRAEENYRKHQKEAESM